MNEPQAIETVPRADDWTRRVLAPTFQSRIYNIVLINLIILLCRPQDELPIIALVGIPIILTAITAVACLARLGELVKISPAIWAMLTILGIGFGWIPFALNNFWAFHTFRDIAQLFVGYLFPILLITSYGTRLRGIATCILSCSAYLGLYSLTHAGKGPGGFLGDENDMCLFLDGLIGFALMTFPSFDRFYPRIIARIAIVLVLAGLIATFSRGGFIGFLLAVLYVFLHSAYKIRLAGVAIIFVLLAPALVPTAYWTEMKTITKTDEGTAKGRIDTWKIGLRIWLRPKYFLFGTGMGNTPWHLHEVETSRDVGEGHSMAGRAVHSSYVQLASDLGTVGIICFLISVGTLITNHRMAGKIRRHRKRGLVYLARGPALRLSEIAPELSASITRELRFIENMLLGANAGLLGVLGAAAFVSALYYPSIWLFVILGLATRVYHRRLAEYLLANEAIPQSPNATVDF